MTLKIIFNTFCIFYLLIKIILLRALVRILVYHLKTRMYHLELTSWLSKTSSVSNFFENQILIIVM